MGNTLKAIIAFLPFDECQKYILGDLEEMPIDKMLDLSGRQVRRFPVCVCSFRELVKLYLSNNNLNHLPPELEELQNLQILALDFNNFHTLPQVVCTLKQLCILYLGNNKLGDLPAEMHQLQNLKTLWIESNCLYSLPNVVCELKHLKTLHAGSNALRSLPEQLQYLTELRTIWLSSNLLTDFPPVLLHMSFLEVIDVDCNAIHDFPSLVHLNGLKLVIYDHNPCRNAPKVAKGVHRVGRWSEESPEPRKRSGMDKEKEIEDINSLLPPLLLSPVNCPIKEQEHSSTTKDPRIINAYGYLSEKFNRTFGLAFAFAGLHEDDIGRVSLVPVVCMYLYACTRTVAISTLVANAYLKSSEQRRQSAAVMLYNCLFSQESKWRTKTMQMNQMTGWPFFI